MNGKSYNLACAYAMKKDKGNALRYLSEALNNKEIKVSFVEDDEDWKFYKNDKEFINLLNK